MGHKGIRAVIPSGRKQRLLSPMLAQFAVLSVSSLGSPQGVTWTSWVQEVDLAVQRDQGHWSVHNEAPEKRTMQRWGPERAAEKPLNLQVSTGRYIALGRTPGGKCQRSDVLVVSISQTENHVIHRPLDRVCQRVLSRSGKWLVLDWTLLFPHITHLQNKN